MSIRGLSLLLHYLNIGHNDYLIRLSAGQDVARKRVEGGGSITESVEKESTPNKHIQSQKKQKILAFSLIERYISMLA